MGKSNSRPESKSDRKFEKKIQFYTKIRDSISSLSATKAITKTKKAKLRTRQKKLKAYDLSSLSEFLPELDDLELYTTKQLAADTKLNSKYRQKLILKEAEHLNAVLSNPAFRADPLAAIHQHLERTQPASESEVKEKKKTRKNGSTKRKGRNMSNASSGSQEMEI